MKSADQINILIAEDEESNYLLLKTILQKHAVLERAKTGVEAIEIYKSHDKDFFDLILMDIKMPQKTGVEAVVEIRKFNTEIPIVMQSAYVFDSDMEAAQKVGATDFVTKPINLKVFKETVSKYVPDIQW